jgi:hypothetical protein
MKTVRLLAATLAASLLLGFTTTAATAETTTTTSPDGTTVTVETHIETDEEFSTLVKTTITTAPCAGGLQNVTVFTEYFDANTGEDLGFDPAETTTVGCGTTPGTPPVVVPNPQTPGDVGGEDPVEAQEPIVGSELSDDKVEYGAKDRPTVELYVDGDPDIGLPTGALSVSVDGRALANVGMDDSGVGQVALPRDLAVGKHTVRVTYPGDTNYTALDSDDGPHTLTVTAAKTKTAVSVKKSYKKASRPTVKVAVTARGSSFNPAGKVDVYVGKKKVGSGKLNSSGKAKIKLAKMKVKGKQGLRVVYAGTKTHSGSTATAAVKIK